MENLIDEKPIFEWTVLPAKKNILKTVLFLVIFGLVIFLIQFSFETPLFTILAAVIMGGSLSSFFIPTTYQIFNDRLRIRKAFSVAEKEFSHYKRVETDRGGIFLSPFSVPNRLDPYRGIYVLLDHPRNEVIEFVKSKLKSNAKN
ncbi:MAG TPA: hypothetical protein ENN73_06910 [Firmicutes bacterium]|nr:hypothetical protein [Bacillota bacterium]